MGRKITLVLIILTLGLFFICEVGYTFDRFQYGNASWYGPKFHGKRTASGTFFDMHSFTAAHRNLPLGTKVKVTNLRNGKAITVKINDRGPFSRRRIIDLSRAAAKAIGLIGRGTARVRLEIL